MIRYVQPLKLSWEKILKKDIFPNLLANIQPIQLLVHVGSGWDWLSNVPVDGTVITLDITEDEIVQCNYSEDGFDIYINFGKGYKFLNIPFESIDMIYIGNYNNWLRNPVPTKPLNLREEYINYLNNEVQND